VKRSGCQDYAGGEKLIVDYAGQTVPVGNTLAEQEIGGAEVIRETITAST
jgi:hypothetical protein